MHGVQHVRVCSERGCRSRRFCGGAARACRLPCPTAVKEPLWRMALASFPGACIRPWCWPCSPTAAHVHPCLHAFWDCPIALAPVPPARCPANCPPRPLVSPPVGPACLPPLVPGLPPVEGIGACGVPLPLPVAPACGVVGAADDPPAAAPGPHRAPQRVGVAAGLAAFVVVLPVRVGCRARLQSWSRFGGWPWPASLGHVYAPGAGRARLPLRMFTPACTRSGTARLPLLPSPLLAARPTVRPALLSHHLSALPACPPWCLACPLLRA